ncbi:solute carrier family 9 member A5, partial [Chelydra serpentina]
QKKSAANAELPNGKPPRSVTWQQTAAVLVAVDSDDEESDSSETEKEDDEGIVFIARATDKILQGKTASGSLDVCPSPRIIPPSPTSAEKELPWKGDRGDLAVYVSSETTKIVPVDMQTAWKQSISSLESVASPPGAEPGPHAKLWAGPALEEGPKPERQVMPEQRTCFQFPNPLLRSSRPPSDSSPERTEQPELQPLMAPDEQGRMSTAAGPGNSRWLFQFNRPARFSDG